MIDLFMNELCHKKYDDCIKEDSIEEIRTKAELLYYRLRNSISTY